MNRIFRPAASLCKGFRHFNTRIAFYSNPNLCYSVGWGTLSVLNAGFADLKGRSRLNWLALSWILGPIATIYLVFFVEKESSVSRNIPSAGS